MNIHQTVNNFGVGNIALECYKQYGPGILCFSPTHENTWKGKAYQYVRDALDQDMESTVLNCNYPDEVVVYEHENNGGSFYVRSTPEKCNQLRVITESSIQDLVGNITVC